MLSNYSTVFGQVPYRQSTSPPAATLLKVVDDAAAMAAAPNSSLTAVAVEVAYIWTQPITKVEVAVLE